jgi:hypothetical protein
MSRNTITVLVYHYHKVLDLIYTGNGTEEVIINNFRSQKCSLNDMYLVGIF